MKHRSKKSLLICKLILKVIIPFILFSAHTVFPFCKTPTPVFENDIHVLSAGKMVAMVHDRYILVLTDANYIQVVDTEDPSLGKAFVQEIQLPGTPRDAAFDPDLPDRVYFLLKEGKIVKMDTARPHPLAWSIKSQTAITGLGMAIAFKGDLPAGVAVATLTENGLSIERYNPDDLSSQGESFPINSPGMITDIEISEKGIYVLLEAAAQAWLIDMDTGATLASGDAGSSPITMALDEKRDQLLIANPSTDSITIIDAATLNPKTTLTDQHLLPSPVAIAIAGDTAYVGGGEKNTQIMPILLDQLIFSGESLVKSDELKDLFVHLKQNTLYMSSPTGVYYAFDDICLRVMVQQRQDLWAPKVEILLSPEEVFGLRIEGGMKPFIHEGAGLSCVPEENDSEKRTYACKVSGTYDYPVVVEDISGHTRTILARVAPALSVSPSTPDPVHVSGDPLTFTANGGFSPVTWQTESGMLSATSGRTVIYFPPERAGYDRISVTDRTGVSVDIPITVELSGLTISPAQALLFPGESKTFTAIGSNATAFEWITTQGRLDWIGPTAVFTADTIGDVELIVRDKLSETQTGLAKIWVVQEELTISPLEVVLNREEGQLFRVSGGKGPYIWSSERGDLSASQGDSVILTAPSVSGRFAVRVSDKTGRVATATATVEGDMHISPVQAIVKPEEEIKFSLINVHGTPSFQAESGYFLKTDSTQAVYKAPPQSGTFDIQMMDERGLTAFARVLVTGPDLTVQPGFDAMISGGSKILTAIGGIGPWYWHADQGLLTAVQGRTVRFLAPAIDEASRTITIVVTDSMGSVATATLTILQNEAIAGEQLPSLFNISPKHVVLPANGNKTLTLFGGLPPYQMTGFGDHITAGLTEDKLSVTGLSVTGASYVEVMDAKGTLTRADIQIYDALMLSHTRLSLPVNGEETLSIYGGLPPYDLLQSDDDGSFTWNKTADDQISLKGITLGRSNLIVRDQAQNTAILALTITSENIRVSPETIDAVIGETVEITVTGGSGAYTFQAQEGDIRQSGSDQFLYTVPDHTGSFTISFFDKNEREINIPVTVRDDFLALTPSKLMLLPGESTLVKIIKGRPPFVATSEKGESLLEEDRIIFTAPSETGRFMLSVRDDGGNTAEANIQILSSISLTPAILYAHPGESMILTAQGGTGDYRFAAESGEFLEIEQGRAIFKCPDRFGHYGVTVSDTLGHKAASLVMVGDVPKGSPAYACLGRNETFTFSIHGGFPPYRAIAEAGTVTTSGQSNYTYTAPDTTGVYTVTLSDARGSMSQVTCDVIHKEVLLTPEEMIVSPGQGAFFEITGGKPPYQIISSIGSLSLAGNGKYRFESPESRDLSNQYYIKATDANGLRASARISIQSIRQPPATQETRVLSTPDEINTAKVRYESEGTSLMVSTQIPAYASPVDIYLLLLLPSQEIMFISSEYQLTPDWVPLTTYRTEKLYATIDALMTLSSGVYLGGWFIAPANGGDIISSLEGPYELGAYAINIP